MLCPEEQDTETADISEKMQARKQQGHIFNQLKEKFANLKLYRTKAVFKIQRQNNNF